MRCVLAILVLVVLAASAALGFVYSGIYDVAASAKAPALESWLFRTTMIHSVAKRADVIEVPEVPDSEVRTTGAAHYAEMCAVCHGAPGRDPTELARGLEPPPPDLTKAESRLPVDESFWTVKHGIRMTGMPAWGETHSDDELWAITMFAQRLPEMAAEEYEELTASGEHGHHREERDGHEGHVDDHSGHSHREH